MEVEIKPDDIQNTLGGSETLEIDFKLFFNDQKIPAFLIILTRPISGFQSLQVSSII